MSLLVASTSGKWESAGGAAAADCAGDAISVTVASTTGGPGVIGGTAFVSCPICSKQLPWSAPTPKGKSNARLSTQGDERGDMAGERQAMLAGRRFQRISL